MPQLTNNTGNTIIAHNQSRVNGGDIERGVGTPIPNFILRQTPPNDEWLLYQRQGQGRNYENNRTYSLTWQAGEAGGRLCLTLTHQGLPPIPIYYNPIPMQ